MRKLISRFGIPLALGVGLLTLARVPALSASDPSQQQNASAKQDKQTQIAPATAQSAGERKFKQNCSRCHISPEGFPPRISGTILRHMRVRASLSQQDERDILHFLNP